MHPPAPEEPVAPRSANSHSPRKASDESEARTAAPSLDETLVPGSTENDPEAPTIAEGMSQLGQYRIEREIGRGGMGAVYLATHERLKKRVALKTLLRATDCPADLLARFEREMEVVGQVEHPNVVSALDAGEADGIHFLVLEYVPGTDLASYVRKKGTLPARMVMKLLIQAADGLGAAHKVGVVHRDVKPSNLLVTQDGTLKVLDLGLARLADKDAVGGPEGATALTQAGSVMGTVDYMAPEQAVDVRKADERSDIYSLGCTLYFLLTGQAVFGGETVMQKLLAHQNEPPPTPKSKSQPVPDGLVRLYERMLAKSPQERPASMAEVADELRALLAKSKSEPRPETDADAFAATQLISPEESLPPRTRPRAEHDGAPPWYRRPYLLAAAGGVPLFCLLAGLIVLMFRTDDATVTITASRPGAQLFIDGERTFGIVDPSDGRRVQVTLPVGPHTLEVKKDGFKTTTKSFTLTSDAGQKIAVTLEPQPSATTTPPPTLQPPKLPESLPLPGPLGSLPPQPPITPPFPPPFVQPADSTQPSQDDAPVSTDPDRTFAKFILDSGGSVTVSVANGQPRQIHKLADYPDGRAELRSVNVYGANLTSDVTVSLLSMPRLSSLDVKGCRISPEAAANFRNLRELTTFDVTRGDFSDACCTVLKNFPKLERLGLGQTNVTAAGLQHVRSLSRLTSLEANLLPATDETLALISGLGELETLYLSNAKITDDGLAHLAKLKKLRTLSLSGCPITSAGIARLGDLSQLRSFSVGGTKLTDAGLGVLGQFPRLETLSLRGCAIDGSGLGVLSRLPELNSLSLEFTNLENDELKHLVDLPKLETLHLSASPVTDGAEPLLVKLTQLRFLSLSGTKLSATAAARITEALPDCRVLLP